MKRILVTGGAGYLGSHICYLLARKGYLPVVYDNLSTGYAANVQWGPLQIGDIRDEKRLKEIVSRHQPAAVIQVAGQPDGSADIGEADAFDHRYGDVISLLSTLIDLDVTKLVLAGWPTEMDRLVDEQLAGSVGAMFVRHLLSELDRISGFRSVLLRHLDAAGCKRDHDFERGRHSRSNVIGRLADAICGKRPCFRIYGDDLPTTDGTFVGDYLHVMDAADAYVRAVDYLLDGGASATLDLGTGEGISTSELIAAAQRMTGSHFEVVPMASTKADPSEIIIDPAAARSTLGWAPQRTRRDMLASAFLWSIRSRGAIAA
ncbi:GDP-mannose 4,6-dehydratase [Notoacmeibacter ruber]|nr:GDP-mannose 4,6-dehydratase [Notoacmeibacter ruber]